MNFQKYIPVKKYNNRRPANPFSVSWTTQKSFKPYRPKLNKESYFTFDKVTPRNTLFFSNSRPLNSMASQRKMTNLGNDFTENVGVEEVFAKKLKKNKMAQIGIIPTEYSYSHKLYKRMDKNDEDKPIRKQPHNRERRHKHNKKGVKSKRHQKSIKTKRHRDDKVLN